MAPKRRMQQIDFKKYVPLNRSTSLLILIISILIYQVVSSNHKSTSLRQSTGNANQITNESNNINNDNNLVKTSEHQQDQEKLINNKKLETNNPNVGSKTNKLACEYDKGQWNECELDGSQTKVMQLKAGDRDCKANKTIRRDCEAVGCKYARGQWSSACLNGQRYRVDTLIEQIGSSRQGDCKPSRRVTKDCRRTCHYAKSAWSDCSNGFRTRLLTLVEDEANQEATTAAPAAVLPRKLPLTSNGMDKGTGEQKTMSTLSSSSSKANHQHCARRKLIRRECRRSLAATASSAHGAPGTAIPPGRRVAGVPQATTIPTASTSMTPAQKRRLKQIQLKQQQSASPSLSSSTTKSVTVSQAATTISPSSTKMATLTTTTTLPTRRNNNDNNKSTTSRRRR